jgi:hypothetical protein
VPFWASRNKTELSKAIHEHATKELEAIEKWEKASESFEPVAKAKKGDKYNFGFFKVFVQYGLGDKRKSQGNVKVKDVYGEIPGTVSVDGMPIDVFINPNMNKNTWDGNVFVMDYMAAGIDKYGQPYMDFTTPRKIIDHKVFVGYETAQEAHAAAIRNFTTSNQIGIPIHQHFEEMSLQDFSVWSRDTAATGKSVKEYGKAKQRRRIEEDRADLAEGQALLNAPNLSWLRKVLGTPVGDRADTELSNILVEKFLQLQERNKELEAKLELPTETYQPTFRNMREYEEARMEAELTRIEKLYPGAGLVFINSNEATEAMTGSKPKNHLERIRQYIHNMGTQAVYDTDTDTIYVFKDRIRDINHLRRVVVHEMFHKGLTRSFSDPAINKIFDNFYKNMNAEQRVEFDRIKKLYKLNEKNPVERREIIEEMFAFYAERGSFDPGFQTWFNQLIQAVKRLLARAKISSTANPWTDTEVQQLIAESHNALKRRTTPTSKEEMGMRYQEEVQLEETGEIFTVERDGAVDLLAIQKRSEACERLKACLGR